MDEKVYNSNRSTEVLLNPAIAFTKPPNFTILR